MHDAEVDGAYDEEGHARAEETARVQDAHADREGVWTRARADREDDARRGGGAARQAGCYGLEVWKILIMTALPTHSQRLGRYEGDQWRKGDSESESDSE